MDFISLEEAKKIKLDKRCCTKYVLTRDMFWKLFNFFIDNFSIVRNDEGNMLFSYNSVYFDTPDYQMNKDHIDKKLHRQKIRVREYESGEKFLEIKDKNNHITTKKRIPVKEYSIDGEKQWISENLMYDTRELSKKINVSFYRMTLISKDRKVRMTLDFNLRFFNYIANKSYNFDKIILEVKHGDSQKTSVEEMLETLEICPQGFSKYVFGLEMTSQ